jgi:hypothetical protein
LSKKYDHSLTVEIKHSLFLGSIFVFLGVGAVLVVATLSLPYGIGWWLAGGVLASLARLLCLHVLGCARHAVCRLKLETSGACAVAHGAHHPWRDCRVVGWFVHPWLVILRLQGTDTGRPQDVLVAWDALPENLFRELRVRVNGLRSTAEA